MSGRLSHFFTYDPAVGGTPACAVGLPVIGVSAAVWKREETEERGFEFAPVVTIAWHYTFIVHCRRGNPTMPDGSHQPSYYYREHGSRPTRKAALATIRTLFIDNFNGVPAAATLRIGRAREHAAGELLAIAAKP